MLRVPASQEATSKRKRWAELSRDETVNKRSVSSLTTLNLLSVEVSGLRGLC